MRLRLNTECDWFGCRGGGVWTARLLILVAVVLLMADDHSAQMVLEGIWRLGWRLQRHAG